MRTLRRGFALFVLLFGGLLVAASTALAYTSPGSPTGYVSDFANVLTPDQETTLANAIRAHKTETTQEIAVVTVPTIGDDTIENYASKLFEEWGIGQKDVDNGVLFLMAVNDRKLRIEVGYGLEDVLTDAETSKIISASIPELKAEQYPRAIDHITNDIITTLNQGGAKSPAALAEKADQQKTARYAFFAMIGVILFSVLIIIVPIAVVLISVMRREKAAGRSMWKTYYNESGSSSSSESSSSSSDSSSSGSSDSFSGGSSGGGGSSGSW